MRHPTSTSAALTALARLQSPINAYSDEGAQAKESLHRTGRAFLKTLAKELGLLEGTYDVRSNKGGIAVSGEVTLHSERLYVQLSESCVGKPGISVLYRACEGRKDYTGHANHFKHLDDLSKGAYPGFVAECLTLSAPAVRARSGMHP